MNIASPLTDIIFREKTEMNWLGHGDITKYNNQGNHLNLKIFKLQCLFYLKLLVSKSFLDCQLTVLVHSPI